MRTAKAKEAEPRDDVIVALLKTFEAREKGVGATGEETIIAHMQAAAGVILGKALRDESSLDSLQRDAERLMGLAYAQVLRAMLKKGAGILAKQEVSRDGR